MRREEWLKNDDPAKMLGWLLRSTARPSDRQLRLLAIAIARHGGCGTWASVGHLIAAAESMADGQPHWLSERELEEAQLYAASWLVVPDAKDSLKWILGHYQPDPEDRETEPTQAAILRDIIGDPFSPPKPLVPPKHSWDCPHCRHYGRYCSVCHGTTKAEAACGSCFDRKRVYTGIDGIKWVPCNVCPKGPPGWLTPEVLSLADAAYTLRTADGTLDAVRLSVLADCLVDAGCDDSHAILSHLRSGGPHYRGMWSLDLLLGKS